MNDEQRDRLFGAARQGRGMWLGLMLEPIVDQHDRLSEYMPTDGGHLTLAHLGKDHPDPDKKTALVCGIAHQLHELFFAEKPLELEITGVGWFWRRTPTVVALVNSARLFDLRSDLLRMLRDDVGYSDRYGFIPHITFRPGITPTSLQHLTDVARGRVVKVPTIHVVCGDEKVAIK